MSENLLIHSMAEFSTITLEALTLADAHRICEIGAEHGGNSTVLADWLAPRGGQLTSVDPAPGEAYLAWLADHHSHVQHIAGLSLDVIPGLPAQDAWFVDGDHNWYTVFHELQAIHSLQREAAQPLLIFLHDVGWPWARRDLYYAPERIPAGHYSDISAMLMTGFDPRQRRHFTNIEPVAGGCPGADRGRRRRNEKVLGIDAAGDGSRAFAIEVRSRRGQGDLDRRGGGHGLRSGRLGLQQHAGHPGRQQAKKERLGQGQAAGVDRVHGRANARMK